MEIWGPFHHKESLFKYRDLCKDHIFRYSIFITKTRRSSYLCSGNYWAGNTACLHWDDPLNLLACRSCARISQCVENHGVWKSNISVLEIGLKFAGTVFFSSIDEHLELLLITTTSNSRYGVSNHRQFDCISIGLSRLIAEVNSKFALFVRLRHGNNKFG